MTYSLAFTINDLPKLPNRLQRAHWRVVSEHAKGWHWRVIHAVGRDRPPQPLQRARVTLVRHSTQEPDHDNLVASWKPVVDGLIHAKVIVDDGPEHVELIPRWQPAPRGKGFVVVSVVEVERG